MWIDVTAFGLSIEARKYPLPHLFLEGFFPNYLSLSVNYDVNKIGRPKSVISIPIFIGHINTATLEIPYFGLQLSIYNLLFLFKKLMHP